MPFAIPEGVRRLVTESERDRYRRKMDRWMAELKDTPVAEFNADEPIPLPPTRETGWRMNRPGVLTSSEEKPSEAPPTFEADDDDPNRQYDPLGKSPELTLEQMDGGPLPAGDRADGVGGPEQPPGDQEELAAIEAELARRELAEIEAELARREGGADIDDAINESVQQIPGGYKSYLDRTDSAKPGYEWTVDPLSPKGRPKYVQAPADRNAPKEQRRTNWDDPEAQALRDIPLQGGEGWNERIADVLDSGVDGIMDVVQGQRDQNVHDVGGGVTSRKDPVVSAAKTFVEPMLRLPSSALRDPVGTFEQVDPAHQFARAYGKTQQGIEHGLKGEFGEAAQAQYEGLLEFGSGALTLAPFFSGPKTGLGGVPEKATVSKPTVKQSGKALAATAVPGRRIRPQAIRAIEKILINSNVPRDRIATGLSNIVERLNGTVDGGGQGSRPLSVGAAIKEEFGAEFPEVRQNVDTVRLERRLTRKRGDASPAIVREAVQDMRGSQTPFLTDSATKNLGGNSRNAKRADMEENLREFGEQGYEPIIAQSIDAARTQRIQDVLSGPGMGELGKPLRQIAAGEGKTIEAMIQESPLRAAHWMQHKARLLSEENGGTTLGNAYTAMRNRILATIDDLKAPDGKTYAQLRKEFADEAKIDKDLKAGNQFGAMVRDPEKANAFVEKFEAATPAQQEAQLASIGDWLLSKLRGGGEEAAARMAEIQSIAVLETLERLGARGKAMADDIRAIRDEEADLGRFFPKAESQTVSNSVALKEGPDIYSKQGGAGASTRAIADAGMMATDMTKLPVLSVFGKVGDAYREMRRPRISTREDMTRVLMSRAKGGGSALREARAAAPDSAPSGGGAPAAGTAIDMAPDGWEKSTQLGQAKITYAVQNDGTMSLEMIDVPAGARGQGEAGRALDKLLAEADANGLTVYLDPQPVGSGGLSSAQLNAFYRKRRFTKLPGTPGLVRSPNERSAPPKTEAPPKGGALDMSEAGRMGRAREQGFDVDTPLYHSSPKPISELKPDTGELGLHVGTKQAADDVLRRQSYGVYKKGGVPVQEVYTRGEFAKVPDLGNWDAYSYLQARRDTFAGRDASVEFDPRYDDMWRALDAAAEEHVRSGQKSFGDWRSVVQREAAKNDLAGWEYVNGAEDRGSISRVIMNPTAARRTDAAFGPSEAGSSRLTD